jgi:hypothetical protein
MRLIALNNFRADRDALLKKKIALEKKTGRCHRASDSNGFDEDLCARCKSAYEGENSPPKMN